MFDRLLKLAHNFYVIAKTRWKKEENIQNVLNESRKRNNVINSNDFKHFFDKYKNDKNVYMRFDEGIRGSHMNPRMTHNFRGLYGLPIHRVDFKKIKPGTFSKRKYVYLFRSKKPETILNIETYTIEQSDADIEKIMVMMPKISHIVKAYYKKYRDPSNPLSSLKTTMQNSLYYAQRPKFEGPVGVDETPTDLYEELDNQP